MPISFGGNTYSDQQIQDFYKNGGNERQFLQQNGVTDPWQARDLTLQARQIGGYKPTMQDNFKQYQQANPTGAFANNYGGWVNDMKNGSPAAFNAMQSGTYTGAPTAATDFAPGGIHYGKQFGFNQSGQGQLGIGDGWGSSDGNMYAGGTPNFNESSGGVVGQTPPPAPGGSSSSYYSSSGGLNPYLDPMAQSITNQMNANWTRNLLPSIRSGASAAGGFGGSRQGVVEANGLRDLNQTLGNSLANLYGTGWQNAQQNALQSRSIDNSYDLGLRSNNLGYANLDSNNAQFGANLALNTLNAQNNWAQNGVNAANQMYQMPLYYQQMFNNMQNNISGQGGSTSQTNQGNPGLGFLGGWQLANGWSK